MFLATDLQNSSYGNSSSSATVAAAAAAAFDDDGVAVVAFVGCVSSFAVFSFVAAFFLWAFAQAVDPLGGRFFGCCAAAAGNTGAPDEVVVGVVEWLATRAVVDVVDAILDVVCSVWLLNARLFRGYPWATVCRGLDCC